MSRLKITILVLCLLRGVRLHCVGPFKNYTKFQNGKKSQFSTEKNG